MYHLIKITTIINPLEYNPKTEIILKSESKKILQDEIKKLFKAARESMREDDFINYCSKADFDEGCGCFYKDNLAIDVPEENGLNRIICQYFVLSEEIAEKCKN